MPDDPYPPTSMGFGQFCLSILALEEQICCVRSLESGRVAEQLPERCASPCGDDVEAFRNGLFDAGAADFDRDAGSFGGGSQKRAFLAGCLVKHGPKIRPLPRQDGEDQAGEAGTTSEV